jgi:hypothetical protein
MVEVVIGQLHERLRPSFTAEQMEGLFGKHPKITGHLIEKVAKAHADELREHAALSGLCPFDAEVSPTKRRVGYLAGDLNNAAQTYEVLVQDQKEYEIWLICSRERSRNPFADSLVDWYTRSGRLIVLEDDAPEASQAALVGLQRFDVLVLISHPTDLIKYVLACFAACHSINWAGLSGAGTHICELIMIGSDSSKSGTVQVIRVGFDQPVRSTRLLSDTNSVGNRCLAHSSKENVGLPAAKYVIMFPGFLVQAEKHSVWTWMQLIAGLDNSVLALTAEPAGMVGTIQRWMKEFNACHDPCETVDVNRIVLLEWQGNEVHDARLYHADLCVSALNSQSSFASAVLAVGNGLLVLEGPGSTDIRASGLGEELIAKSAEEFVKKGVAWASRGKAARAFLSQQQQGGLGYYAKGRVAGMVYKVIESVLAGETSFEVDPPEPLCFVDDRTARLDRILEQIETQFKSRNAKMPLNYAPGFRDAVIRILIFLENEGIKFSVLVGLGGSAMVVKGTMTRNLSSRVPSGMEVVVKIDITFRRFFNLHNSSILRDSVNCMRMNARMRNSKCWSGLFSKPIYLLHGGRSFMGCTEPGKSKHVVLFSVFQFVGKNLEDTLEEAARDWLETATVSNELVVVCQEIFLGLWHAHRNGFYNRDIKPQNMGQDPEGKVVFWDMGHGRCDEPKSGGAYGKKSVPSTLMRRHSTAHFPGGSNPQGHAFLYKPSRQGNRVVPFLFFTDADFKRGDELSQQKGRGLGRLGNASYTYEDQEAARKRAEAVQDDEDRPEEDKNVTAASDVFQTVRCILQVFNKVDWRNPVDWERRASEATSDGDPGTVLQFLKSGTRGNPLQLTMLKRFARFFARALGPLPRPSLIDLMTDLALTSPVFPPADEQDVLNGRGIAFPGGSAGSVYPGIMSEWKCLHIPSTSLLLEPDGKGGDIGLGNRAEEHIKDKSLAGFYCGRKRALYEGAMDTPPSRYGVSVRSAQQREKFSIDGFMGPKLTIQWLKTHQVTGPFMNAGNWKNGPRSNVTLDRHSAWTDPATGIVWIPMYADGNIAAGDFLRWTYNPTDGEAGIYNFCEE